MQKHPDVTKGRIRQFMEFQLQETIFHDARPVKGDLLIQACSNADVAKKSKDWTPVEPGDSWGPTYQEGWYRLKLDLPKEWRGKQVVLLNGDIQVLRWTEWPNLDVMCEGTVWLNNRQVGGLDHGHPYVRLSDDFTGELFIQLFARNRETTVHRPEKPRTPKPEKVPNFHVALLDEEKLALFYDCEHAFNLAEAHDEKDPLVATVIRALNDICNTYEADKPKTWSKCRKILKDALGSLNTEYKHTLYPVGHAHLDTAWLWPLSVTHLKMFHTTAIQLDLIDRYPEHVFAHSQASQYEWLEKEQPELFERVKSAIKKGQWEVVGSMWVEADCNLTGAESLVRQFLYGRRYYQQKLGVETVDMWLPDVFGYSAALPQILNRFQIKAFLTQKMSWNQFNKIPHNTFFWKGIDGSSIWTHFPPVDTYIASGAPKEMIDGVKRHRDQGRSDASLYLYGFGDGGGGPTEWHIERLRRARTSPGLPFVESKIKAKQFFTEVREQSHDLMTWAGELYFEYHRGTYTSQAANKRFNRLTEFLLRDAEWLSCFRKDFDKAYPAERLEAAWKLILLNQFHDIIPGSSVREVYEDSDRDYAQIIEEGEALVKEAIESIVSGMDTSGMNQPVAIFHNADVTSEASVPWAEKEAPQSITCGEESLPVQLVETPTERKIIFPVPAAARGTVAVADLSESSPYHQRRLKVGSRKIESDEWAVKFDANGNITSIQSLDDEPIEFIQPGKLANLFQILDDRPLFWDAWDTDAYAQETAVDLVKSDSFEIVERGPVRVAVELVKTFGKSTIRQRISLGPTPGIRFDTWVDWHEDFKFLKVAFPLNVNTNRATFEIQFGHVERPTHRNTSWDMARFEVCAQKWVDMSEGGHGVALINTGKYGHDVLDNVLRLSLLRSPKAPDPICDRGQHHFSYVLMPHFDQVQHSEVIQAAYAVNADPRILPLKPSKGESGELPPLVSVDNRSVVIESVKKAEDSKHLIVRMYECHNTRGAAHLSMAMPIKRAWVVDLNETILSECAGVSDGTVAFNYTPFEIVTLMVEI